MPLQVPLDRMNNPRVTGSHVLDARKLAAVCKKCEVQFHRKWRAHVQS